ncbi:MAG: gliding motility protein GldC [Chitinophagia bacterium]|nr:gliding motility protein GldC [Chitinophagia bacterium]
MNTSAIVIEVTVDDKKMPEQITWTAPGAGVSDKQNAKAFLLGLWDGAKRETLRIDLWTQSMMVDEMNDFFAQTLQSMALTYSRATKNSPLAEELKEFAKQFLEKAANGSETTNP